MVKICPFMTARLNWKADCEENKCAWWDFQNSRCFQTYDRQVTTILMRIGDTLDRMERSIPDGKGNRA